MGNWSDPMGTPLLQAMELAMSAVATVTSGADKPHVAGFVCVLKMIRLFSVTHSSMSCPVPSSGW